MRYHVKSVGSRLIGTLLFLGLTTAVLGSPITVMKDDVHYVVNPDATYSVEETETFRVTAPQAVQQ